MSEVSQEVSQERNPRSRQPFSFQDRQMIEKLIKENLTGSEIARRMNRSRTGVNCEIRINGGRDQYSAASAQKNHFDKMTIRSEHLSKMNKGKAPVPKYLQKIESLEMHIEILHDTIKELMKK